MKKLLIIIISLVFVSYSSLKAQNIQASDMLLYSQHYPLGTARAIGMGGAFGALGGDQTSLSINPAGIGVYRSSDFSFTLSLNDNNSSADYFNHTSDDFSTKLKIGNIGYVYTYNTNKDQGWVSASFGIAYNRLNDFNRNIVIKNPSANSSLLDKFDYYANDQGRGALPTSQLNQYYEGLAWDTYLLDTVLYGPGWYHSDFSGSHTYGQSQERTLQIRGGIGEYAFSFGANYSNRLYIGATIGIQSLTYEETTEHTETDVNGDIPNLSSFTFTEYRNVYGTGYNFKTGIIYRPIDLIRIGLAVHSPTYYNINSEFHTRMDAYYDIPLADNSTYSSNETPVRAENNILRSPWTFVGSLALQFKQYGLLSVDYERLDYGNMRLTGDDIANQNDDVSADYKAVNNIRVGAEGKIGPMALRAGFGYYGTPYKSSDLKFITYKTYSAGIGFRGKKAYFDLAYMLLQYPDKYLLYQYVESENNGLPTWQNSPNVSDIKYNLNRFVATVGFRF